ncbi:MAG: hypothetical protein V7K77_13005 [Nostoc sp.]
MAIRFILSDYVDRAMSDDKPLCVYAQAIYDKLEVHLQVEFLFAKE